MNHATLQDRVRHALGRSTRGTVVAAVSGGPDSMAMFHALCVLARDIPGLRVVAAHFDHRLRPGSEHDIDVINNVAERFDVRVFSDGTDIAARARESSISIESAGRIWRYTFFGNVSRKTRAGRIATAHTRDDQVETVMMRILRGADSRGLRGIAAGTDTLLRPLLDVTHTETIDYCETHGVPYIIDPTNADHRYFRNRVRHDVLPSLRLFYPGIDDALIRIRESAHAQFVRAERATEGRVPEYLRLEGREWRLSLDALAGLDEDYRLHVLARVIEKIGIRDVTGVHYRAMLAGSSVDVPGWHVRPEHDGLVFMPRSAARSAAPRPLHVPGTTFIADWTFRAAPVRNAAAHDLLQNRPHEVALLAADGPFTVRFAQPGDRMRPFGMRGHKKLSDLFIDRKIPRRKRSRIPVIEANGEILWVAGIATSELARIQPGSARVVRIVAGRSHD